MLSTTLNLVDHLVTRGRHLQEIGRTRDALRVFTRLANFRELPGTIAEEVQAHLGELQMRRRKWVRARRHLTAALRHDPTNPRYHFLLGQTFDNDRDGNLPRAAEHYKSALELDGNQTDCRCAYGKLLLRQGRTDEGSELLRTAVRQAPDDLKVLRNVVEGLRLANRADEARSLLIAARFRHPRDARYVGIWNDFQFQAIRRAQEEERTQPADEEEATVFLPFVRPEREAAAAHGEGRILRNDLPSSSSPHTGSLRPDQRQAR
jgi:tetratricopeptide (TPR) repeat protein